MISLCILHQKAILAESMAMVAFKWPQRSNMTSESKSVTSITQSFGSL